MFSKMTRIFAVHYKVHICLIFLSSIEKVYKVWLPEHVPMVEKPSFRRSNFTSIAKTEQINDHRLHFFSFSQFRQHFTRDFFADILLPKSHKAEL